MPHADIIEKRHRLDKARQRKPLQIVQIRCRDVSGPYSSRLHTHNRWQFFCVTRGEGVGVVDDSRFAMPRNTAVLVSPGTPRRFQHHADPLRTLYAIVELRGLSPASCANRPVAIPPSAEPQLCALVSETMRPGTVASRNLCEALLLSILIEIVRKEEPDLRTPSPAGLLNRRYYGEVVARVEEYMEQNLHRTLRRDELARVAFMSHQHLNRVFKTLTGRTPRQHLTDLRLRRASDLLLHSTLPVTEIAFEVGFQSFSHFTQLFKRHIGRSPSAFRADALT